MLSHMNFQTKKRVIKMKKNNNIKVINSLKEWILIRDTLQVPSIGFVPTMGALHQGHIELVKKSCSENQINVASIFVNPTQFNDPKDLDKYPRTIEKDIELLSATKLDYLILPKYDEIYNDNYRFQITENEITKILCGKSRPGHFTGVLTIVMKLLNISGATRAYFGEKDFQQLELIRQMCETFFMKVKIIPCPTIREKSGLAMSSRNRLLSDEGKMKASNLYYALTNFTNISDSRKFLEEQGFEIDYLEEHFGRRFAAVKLENVRLIDNVKL